jgi:hypothetical protein
MKEVLQKLFLAIVLIPLFISGCVTTSTTSSTKHVSAIQVKSVWPGNNKNLYQVTCDNGKQHTIIANHAEQDFQYYYPNKGYYIKYYDMDFKDLINFARWVCRNN